MLLSAVAATLVTTTVLALWNWSVASRVHEWSTDPKNTYLFIVKRLRPGALRRDFPFSDERIFRFYQPLYMGVAVRLARWFGSIVPATRVLHFVFTFAYFLGWTLLGRSLGASWLAMLLFFAALVTYVPVTGADGIGVGAPGTWWSRSMANAFVPWFGLLAYVHLQTGNMMLWAFVLIGVLLHIHPVVAVGLLPALAGLLAIDAIVYGHLPVGETLSGFVVLGLFGLVFVVSYFRSSTAPSQGAVDWDRVNSLAFNRFRLWPYALVPEKISLTLSRLNRVLHVTIGCAYLIVVAVVLLAPLPSAGARYYWLTTLNFAILVFLHIPPGEGSGVRLAVLAALGATRTLSLSGPLGIEAVLALLVFSRFRMRRVLLGLATALTTVLLLAGPLNVLAWNLIATRHVSLFEWWLAIIIPGIFAWYLAGSLVTMDLLPLRLHQPLKIIDWGRTAKIVQLPMYLYVLWFAQDIARGLSMTLSVETFGGVILAALFLASVLVNPYTAYRHRLDSNDKGLFEWARQSDDDSLFHIVSADIWFGFDFRANTIRSITGSWKDGGICHYSNVERFFEWDARMRLVAEGIGSGKMSTVLEQGAGLGADFVVVDRRVPFEDDAPHPTVYANQRWEVRSVVRPLRPEPVGVGLTVMKSDG